MLVYLLGVILFFVYQLVIRPYFKARYYIKNGFKYYYSFLNGIIGTLDTNVKVHGHSFHSLIEEAKDGKYRGLVSNVVNDIIVFVFDTEIKKQLLDKPSLYHKTEISTGIFKAYLPSGMLFIDGDKWKLHRKLASTFLNYENMRKLMVGYGKYFQESFGNLKQKNLQNINIMDTMRVIISDATSKMFFGTNLAKYPLEGQPFCIVTAKLYAELGLKRFNRSFLVLGSKRLPRFLFRDHEEFLDRIEKVKSHGRMIYQDLKKDLEKARLSGNNLHGKNLLQIFYDYMIENPNEKNLTEEDIIDEFLLIFSASYETSARLLSNALFYLDQHPHYKVRLLDDINKYYDENNVDIEHLNKMSFMQAYFNECLRLMPLVPSIFTREALQDDKIAGLEIKKGTRLNMLWISSNCNPNYHEEPDRFYPERWLDPNSLTMKSYTADPSIFSPFSVGPKSCIGKLLAPNEAKILFSVFLKNFDFEVANRDMDKRLILRFLLETMEDVKVNLYAK